MVVCEMGLIYYRPDLDLANEGQYTRRVLAWQMR